MTHLPDLVRVAEVDALQDAALAEDVAQPLEVFPRPWRRRST